jgi:predicted DNA-binding transcriptional regulator AlpA
MFLIARRKGELMQPRYASIRDVNQTYGFGRTTTYRLLSEGTLKGVKLGKRTLLDMASVAEAFAALPPAQSGKPQK